MSQVAVTKIHAPEQEAPSLLEELKALTNRIGERAFAAFRRRGSGDGLAVDDWLQAERDLTLAAESDLVEKDSKYQLSVAVPGFSEKNLEVTAVSDAIIVRAEATHRHENDEGNVHYCEFGEKKLLRRFNLPGTIDVDKVTAQLDKGILRITAAKEQKAIASVAAAA